ncbi:hypothetical protein GCM10009577_77240 [Streptomyces javensis]
MALWVIDARAAARDAAARSAVRGVAGRMDETGPAAPPFPRTPHQTNQLHPQRNKAAYEGKSGLGQR